MGGFAWVTLATNDSYSLGALVLAHSLKQVGTRQQLVVLVTPGVTNSMKQKLQSVFDLVQEVNILDSKDETNLKLLKRPELGVTFTKLHCWRLTQFDKCVFLDADTLVLQNCDELFEREELSAAPDVGWPDCFNSGVFVYKPSTETYEKLVQLALEKGSFDGGDQGLLNMFFADWATKDISKHLPFIYNLCSTACYSYLPAFKQFGANAKIIHFIGSSKPWLQYFNTETRKVQPSPEVKHLEVVLQRWWDIFCNLIHSSLTPDMAGLAGAFAQLTLGAPRTAEQSALDDHLRRQGWEVGNIDYLGRDSFDNIWSKICETLQTAVAAAEPPKPKEPTPPASEVKPSEKTALEAPQETPKPTSEVPTPASPVPQQQQQQQQQQQPEPEVPQQCPLKAAETPQIEPSICPLPPKTQETTTTPVPASVESAPAPQQPPSPQPIQEPAAVPQSPKPAESPKAAEPAPVCPLKPATPTQETAPAVAPKEPVPAPEPVPPESPKAAEPAPACPLKPATPTQETAPKEPVPPESPKAIEPVPTCPIKPATPTQETAPTVASPKEPVPAESPKAAEPAPTCPAKPATPKEPVLPESPKAAEPAPACPIKPATPTQETAPVPPSPQTVPAPQPPVPESPKPTPGKGEPEPAKQEQTSEPGTGGASSVASPTPPPRKGSGGGKKASKSKK